MGTADRGSGGFAIDERAGDLGAARSDSQLLDDGAFLIVGLLEGAPTPRRCLLDFDDQSSIPLVIGAATLPCGGSVDYAIADLATVTVELDGVRLPTVSQRVAAGGTDDEFDVEFGGQWATTTPLTAGTYELTTSGTVDDPQFSEPPRTSPAGSIVTSSPVIASATPPAAFSDGLVRAAMGPSSPHRAVRRSLLGRISIRRTTSGTDRF